MLRQITILNIDNTLTSQHDLLHRADTIIDMTNIRGTNLMCSSEAQIEIRDMLKRVEPGGIMFIGNGNFHYISYLLMKRIHKPFSLVLFDHHTDCKNTEPQLACDNWVMHALNLPMLRKALVFHTNDETLDFDNQIIKSKLIEIKPGDRMKNFICEVQKLEGEDVYLSIDKDILSEDVAATNWDQGSLSLDKLLEMIEVVKKHKKIIGADVCGEYPENPAMILQSYVKDRNRMNQKANLAIMEELTH